MKREIIIRQLHTLKEEALNSKMDEPTVTRKIKEAIDLVSPLSELFIKHHTNSMELISGQEFDSFINKSRASVDKVINRNSDLLFFCNTIFRMINTNLEVNHVN